MRGTGPVTIGTDVVYADFATAGNRARLWASADEADRLDLFAGRQVLLGLGWEPGRALVTGVSAAPPFVWVGLELAAVATRPGPGEGATAGRTAGPVAPGAGRDGGARRRRREPAGGDGRGRVAARDPDTTGGDAAARHPAKAARRGRPTGPAPVPPRGARRKT